MNPMERDAAYMERQLSYRPKAIAVMRIAEKCTFVVHASTPIAAMMAYWRAVRARNSDEYSWAIFHALDAIERAVGASHPDYKQALAIVYPDKEES